MSDEPDHFATSKSWASVDTGDTRELLFKAFTLITFAMSAHKPGEDFKRYAERWVLGYDVHCGARRPIDVSWVTPQPPETWLQRQPVWRILAAVFGGITLFFAAMIAIASAVGAL